PDGSTGAPDPPPTALDALEATIADRLARPSDQPDPPSYVRTLADGGWPRLLAKLAEESAELGAELPAGPRERVIAEAADALFHLLVALGVRGVRLEEIERELGRRAGTSGLVEKAERHRPSEPPR